MEYNEAVESIKRYVEHRIPTGDFLRACLENDLSEAVGRADSTSLLNLGRIVHYIHWEIPGTCHGSREKVENWLKGEENA